MQKNTAVVKLLATASSNSAFISDDVRDFILRLIETKTVSYESAVIELFKLFKQKQMRVEKFEDYYLKKDWHVPPPIPFFLECNNLDLLKRLAKKYVKEWNDEDGKNALFFARSAKAVDYLVLKIGLEVSQKDNSGLTAITANTNNEARKRLLHYEQELITKNVDIEKLGDYDRKGKGL